MFLFQHRNPPRARAVGGIGTVTQVFAEEAGTVINPLLAIDVNELSYMCTIMDAGSVVFAASINETDVAVPAENISNQ